MEITIEIEGKRACHEVMFECFRSRNPDDGFVVERVYLAKKSMKQTCLKAVWEGDWKTGGYVSKRVPVTILRPLARELWKKLEEDANTFQRVIDVWEADSDRR